MNRNPIRTLCLGLGLWLVAVPAFAGGFCSDTTPCKSATDTCHGNYCVPTAKLCTGDSTCQAWEACNFTCPMGMAGGGSGSGGTTTVDAGSTGSGTGSTDAASSGGGGGSSSDATGFAAQDGGAGIPVQIDAGGPPQQTDAMPNSGDAMPMPDMDEPPVSSNCPKSPGVCVAVLQKVPVQSACEALCKTLVPCNLSFGSGSSGGSSGGGVPGDAGSTEPATPDGGTGTDPMPDGMGFKADVPTPSYDGGAAAGDAWVPADDDAMGPPDVGPGPDQMGECVALCSLWTVDKSAPAELAALQTCVGGQTDCAGIQKTCETSAKALMAALEANDAWSLGIFGSFASSGSEAGGTKGGDAAAPLAADAGNGGPNGDKADATSGMPQTGDATGDGLAADAGGGASAEGSSPPAKSGCSAGTSPHGSSTALGLLAVAAYALVRFRRKMA